MKLKRPCDVPGPVILSAHADRGQFGVRRLDAAFFVSEPRAVATDRDSRLSLAIQSAVKPAHSQIVSQGPAVLSPKH